MQKQILALLASFSLVSATAFASTDSFVGKWKFNPDKSRMTGLQYKIEDAGGGQYRFIFGDDVETLTLDGKGHVTKYGETWSIKTTGPSSWESTTRRGGEVTAKSNWTVSKDGRTFTSIDENMRPDGTTGRSQGTYKRTGGTSGLVGSWESTSIKILSPTSIEVAAWQGDGYSLINPPYKQRLDFKLDGKACTPRGPRVAKGTTVTARRIDDHNIELTYKLKGKTTETHGWKLSSNGKTLTETIAYSGVSKPEIDAYNRE